MNQYGHDSGSAAGFVPGLDSNGHTRTSAPSALHAIAANHQTFNYNMSGIPGLGLGSDGLGGQGWPTERPNGQTPSQPAAPISLPGASNGSSEEGEVSEEDLDELYEPNPPVDASAPGLRADGESEDNGEVIMDLDEGSSASSRAGSYSPYLSPREVDSAQEPTPISQPGPKMALEEPALGLDSAKSKAQETIARLWPHQVSFQSYIEEGVDRVVLQSLFQELGLEVPNVRKATAQDAPTNAMGSSMASLPSEAEKSPQSEEGEIVETAAPQKTLSKAEERKDRIARLLAAKKTTAPVIAPPEPAVAAIPSPEKATSSRPPSDLSKLLQQKMDALHKSRQGLMPNQTNPDATKTTIKSPPGDPTALRQHEPREQSASADARNLEATPSATDGKQANTNKRPLAADLNESSSLKRPFGQLRDTKQHFIDVSDDEEDEEIEIESNALSSPVLRAAMPARTTSFRDQGPLSSHTSSRPFGSPNVVTPPVGQNGVDAKNENLEKMNKQIEEMKRKIAEAEARKKMKQSPSLSSPTPDVKAAIRIGSSGGPTPEPFSALKPAIASSPVSAVLPKTRGTSMDVDRRRRSRAASERLPLIEAQRREQQLRLQLLQDQMARIQQEIADSVHEETRLREEVDVDVDMTEPTTSMATLGNGSPADPTETPTESIEIPSESIAAVGDPAPSASGHADMDEPMTEARSDSRISSEEAPTPEELSEEALVSDEASESPEVYEPPDPEPPVQDTEVGLAPESSDPSVNDSIEQSLPRNEASANDAAPSTSHEAASETMGEEINDEHRPDFSPYESPLQYFRAFRFHPEFDRVVPGGLRSLTYSNRIDVQRPFCPEDAAGEPCPRGAACQFQHFDTMQAQDDQILVELGAHNDVKVDQKQEFVSGLRRLLTDFRDRQVVDFQTISQGIIDYRARFNQDKSKILPLGHVAL